MNEHQLFMFLQRPKHLSRQGPDVEQSLGGGACIWGHSPFVSSKACHFWEGAGLWGEGFRGFEGVWGSVIEMKNVLLIACPHMSILNGLRASLPHHSLWEVSRNHMTRTLSPHPPSSQYSPS